MKEKAVSLFYTAAQGAMRTAGIPILDNTNLIPDDVMVAVSQFEEASGKKLEQMEDYVEALEAFQGFLEQYEPDRLYTMEIVTITIPLKGGASVSIGVKPRTDNIAMILEALRKDVRQLASQNISEETANTMTNNTQNTDTQGNSTVQDGNEFWPVTKIKKEYNKEGKIIIRIVGGRWLAYGVPMYKEEAETYPFLNEMPVGEFDPPYKMRATAFIKDGKPKRITKLEKM